MKRTRRTFDSKFKAPVAIEAIRERETLNDNSAKYGISPVLISRWKKEFLENSAAAFETPKTGDSAMEKEHDRYFRRIGDLEMQLVFAKRVSIPKANQHFHAMSDSGSEQRGTLLCHKGGKRRERGDYA